MTFTYKCKYNLGQKPVTKKHLASIYQVNAIITTCLYIMNTNDTIPGGIFAKPLLRYRLLLLWRFTFKYVEHNKQWL